VHLREFDATSKKNNKYTSVQFRTEELYTATLWAFRC